MWNENQFFPVQLFLKTSEILQTNNLLRDCVMRCILSVKLFGAVNRHRFKKDSLHEVLSSVLKVLLNITVFKYGIRLKSYPTKASTKTDCTDDRSNVKHK